MITINYGITQTYFSVGAHNGVEYHHRWKG